MIGRLEGALRDSAPNLVVLDVGGVGYEVHIPLSTFYELQKMANGDVVALHVHTHVREDTLALYGFWTLRERRLFEQLITISGIGPRLAQTVLSGMPPDDLVAAIAAADVRRLNTIPGVGKKTAERMVVELKEKMQAVAAETAPARAGASDAEQDLVLALVQLGYRQAAARRAVERAVREAPDDSFAEQLRISLKLLSGL